MFRVQTLDRSCTLVVALAAAIAGCASASSPSEHGSGGNGGSSITTTGSVGSGTTSSGSGDESASSSSGGTGAGSGGSGGSGSTVSSTGSGSGGGSASSGGGGGSAGSGSGGGGSGGSGSASASSASSSGGGSCDPNAWVYMGNDPNACDGHLGEPCGWTTDNEGQGYHCQTVTWGTGCEPGGTTCPGGSTSASSASSSSSGASTSSSASSSSSSSSGSTGNGAGVIFSPYKDVGINMNWNTNVVSTSVSGASRSIGADLVTNGGKTITLAFATGECGSENWAGVPGAAMATANVPQLEQAGAQYIISTGGAAGSFTCGTDAGMTSFIDRWASSGLVGVDFDIEAGQSQAVIEALIHRIQSAHAGYPKLRFSLTLGTLANNDGASTAKELGAGAPDSFNTYGDMSLQAVESILGFDGSASSWPSYLTVNLMTMDYGGASSGVCVVSGGECQMGQSALQAAYNLHDKWGVPYANIELTPMIGGNDTQPEAFTLADADTVTKFVLANGLAGIHYWSYDRDADCPAGASSSTCNSLGNAGTYGFLKRFLGDGLH